MLGTLTNAPCVRVRVVLVIQKTSHFGRFEVVVPSKRASSGPVIERYIGGEGGGERDVRFHRLQHLFALLPEPHQTQLRYQAQTLWKAVGVAYVHALA